MDSGACTKCGREGADKACGRCGDLYHPECIGVRMTRSETFVCEKCQPKSSLQQEVVIEDGESENIANVTIRQQHPEFASTPFARAPTGAIPKGQRERELEREIERLRQQVTVLSSREEPVRNPIGRPSIVFPAHNRLSGTMNLPRTTNQAATALRDSIRTEPLTNAEAERRRRESPLPQFNGDPVMWLRFISSYEESTIACGYSNQENIIRLEKALVGVAKKAVEHLLPFPHRLPKMMELLANNFGSSSALRSAILHKIRLMPALKADLSNVGDVYGAVEAIATALELSGQDEDSQSYMDEIDAKLPVTIAREWYRFAAVSDIMHFRDFISSICDDMTRRSRFAYDEPSKPATATTKKATNQRIMVTQADKPTKMECVNGCSSVHTLDTCPKFTRMAVADRWRLVKKKRLCVRCFGPHWPSKCLESGKCPIPDCQWKHHKLLHSNKDETAAAAVATTTQFVGLSRDLCPTLYRVLPVKLTNGSRSVHTYAFLDTGSSVTLIDKDLARQLGLNGAPTHMNVAWFGDECRTLATERVQFTVGHYKYAFQQRVIAQTVNNLSLPIHTISASLLKDEGLEDVPIEFISTGRPRLLIGQDYANLMRTIVSREGSSGKVVASQTPLGWVIEGRGGQESAARCLHISEADSRLYKLVNEYIEADHFGLIPDEEVRWDSDENLRARRLMDQFTTFNGDRFETALLWRTDDITLPNNRSMAMKRHESLMKKLRRDPPLWDKLTAFLKSYEAKNYIRRIDGATANRVSSNRSWILPIFPVTNPNKPEKVRLVWDAAAEFDGVSLNSTLLTGPDLNSSLVDVLLRMRNGRIAITGDIAEMFHQVLIRPEDRAAQHFLWQGVDDSTVHLYEMRVMTFGAACSPSLAQYVKNTNALRYEREKPAAVRAIIDNHYVDDWLESCDTAEEAVALAQDVAHIHRSGGFTMHKWQSNSQEFMVAMGASITEDSIEVSRNDSKVLGLNWQTSNDCFVFRWRSDKFGPLDDLLECAMPTKRELLRMAMTIYDPLGLVAHITVLPRIILRDVWRTNIDWDDRIDEEMRSKWTEWIECLRRMTTISIPRWYGVLGNTVDIHVFADASEKALAAVAYVVLPGGGARSLIMGKCKVAPTKMKSIPRLELDAAVLATRVLKTIQKALKWDVKRVVMWSDARDVLYWLRSTTRNYTAYVANRVATILSSTAVGDWRWVPSEHNPADWATKYHHQANDDLWWHGPSFLGQEETQWPNSFEDPPAITEIRCLVVKSSRSSHPLIPSPDDFSSWTRFVINTASVKKFVALVRKQRCPGPLTKEERDDAETIIFIEAQRQVNWSDKNVLQFSPFQDSKSVWRMRGRAANAPNLLYDARFPIILPKGHRVTMLLLLHYHRTSEHGLVDRTLNEFRQRFVTSQARRQLMQVIRNCAYCNMLRTKPYNPEMAALPTCRVAARSRPFTYVGVDVFGPIEVVIGRRHEKRWGILFTCLTTRGVYLELLYSLSAASCIKAIDSLVARRGMPVEMRSDCGTNFIAAAKLYRGPNGHLLGWKFNAPRTSHTGGSWERLIGLTKQVLTNMKMERTPTEERLRWFLAKAELLLNSRPLTHLPADEDQTEAITPNHFLLGSSSGLKDNGSRDGDLDRTHLEELNADLQVFWSTWTRRYLPSISTRSKWTTKQDNLKIGDIVYICDGDYRRAWRRGVVEEVQLDEEAEQVRQVVVRTADGTRYRRGVSMIAPLVRAGH